jgi:hypothetical protein
MSALPQSTVQSADTCASAVRSADTCASAVRSAATCVSTVRVIVQLAARARGHGILPVRGIKTNPADMSCGQVMGATWRSTAARVRADHRGRTSMYLATRASGRAPRRA